MKRSAIEVSFFQLLKLRIECDKLQYKYRDAIVPGLNCLALNHA